MAKARHIVAALALALGGSAQALDRQFPEGAKYCEGQSHALPAESTARLAGRGQVKLSAALVIREQNNRIVVSGMLPQQWRGMCVMGIDGSLEKLWLLTPEQARAVLAADKERASPGAR